MPLPALAALPSLLLLSLGCSNAGLYPDPDKLDDTGAADDSGIGDDTGALDDTGTDLDARPPAPGELILSELMIDAAVGEDDQYEWVELHNASADPLDLEGVELWDEDGDGVTLHGLALPAGGWLLLAASEAVGEAAGVTPDMIYDAGLFRLGNGDGAAEVRLGGEVLDALAYDAAIWPIVEGRAMSRRDPSAGGVDDPAAWCASDEAMPGGDYGTPHAAPGACYAAVVEDADGDGVTVGQGDCDDGDASVYPGAAEGADGLDNDCDGLTDEAPPLREEIVITEIMKNPDLPDEAPGEWFEIVSVADHPLEVVGMVVEDDGGEAFDLPDLLLLPGEHVLIAASDDPAINGGIAPDAIWAGADFRLGNDDDEVVLTLDGEEIDAVRYDNGFPDNDGHSLSLDPDKVDADDNDDQDNWCEGVDPYGAGGNEGTPGAANPEC